MWFNQIKYVILRKLLRVTTQYNATYGIVTLTDSLLQLPLRV